MSETITTQYTPREMLAAIEIAEKVPTFLLNLLVKDTETHASKYIELDISQPGHGIPAYVSRVGDAEVVNKLGYDSKIHLLPYTKQQITMTPEELDTRLPGETVYGGSSPAARLDTLVGKYLAFLNNRIGRLEEKQLADALVNGTAVISGDGVSYTITYGRHADNAVTKTSTERWSESTADIPSDFRDAAKQVRKPGIDGGVVTDVIMGEDAANWFADHDSITGKLDNRRIDRGEISPIYYSEMDASYIGTWKDAGINCDVWSYHGQYKNSSGTVTPFIAADKAIFLNRNMRVIKHYAMLANLKSGTFIGERFPMNWIKDDGSASVLQVESGPLVATHWPNSTYALSVNG